MKDCGLARFLAQTNVLVFLIAVLAVEPTFAAASDLTATEILTRYDHSRSWLQSAAMAAKSDITVGIDQNGVGGIREILRYDYRCDGDRLEFHGQATLFTADGVIDTARSCEETIIKTNAFAVEFIDRNDEPPRFITLQRQFDARRAELMCSEEYQGALDGRPHGSDNKDLCAILRSSKTLQVEPEREDVGGQSCYVLRATSEYGLFRVWIAPGEGFSLLKFTIEKNANDLFNASPLSALSVGSGHGSEAVRWFASLDHVMIQKVNGICVPVGGEFVHTLFANNGLTLTDRDIFSRSDLNLKPNFIALKAFQINVPNGTLVHDLDLPPDSGLVYVWRNGREEILVDENDIKNLDAKVQEVAPKSNVPNSTDVQVASINPSSSKAQVVLKYAACILLAGMLALLVSWRWRALRRG